MRIKKSIISIFLCLLLVLGLFPSFSRADGEESYWRAMSTSYYFDRMSDAQRQAYNRFDSTCMNILLSGGDIGSDSIQLQDLNLSMNDFSLVYQAFVNSNPQYFFLSDRIRYYTRGGIVTACGDMLYTEFYNGAKRTQYKDAFRAAIDKYVADINSKKSSNNPTEIEYWVHKLLTQNVSYREGAGYNQSALGLFVTNESVCAGYSKAFLILTRIYGLDTIIVLSDLHAWNAINLYGYWYLVDVTNDDAKNGDELYYLYNTTLENAKSYNPSMYEISSEFTSLVPPLVHDNMGSDWGYTDPLFMATGNTYFIVDETDTNCSVIMLEQRGYSNPSSVYYEGVTYKVVENRAAPAVHAQPTARPQIDAKINNKNATKNIRAFIDRIYINILDREPESEGANFWTGELYRYNKTGAEVAYGFLNSPEFINRDTDDYEYVDILYRTFFDRDADDDGMNYWVDQLSSGYMDRTMVADGFVYSLEWANTCAKYGILSGGTTAPTTKIKPSSATNSFVERMYTTALKRDSDPDGQSYWANLLSNYEMTGEGIGTFFFVSEEMNGLKLNNSEYVNRLYLTFMDREPDADGKAYWVEQLKSKSRLEVVMGFTRSAEFIQNCVDARILPF